MPLMKVCAVSGIVDRTSISNGSVRKTDIPSLGNCICTSASTVTEVYSTPVINNKQERIMLGRELQFDFKRSSHYSMQNENNLTCVRSNYHRFWTREGWSKQSSVHL